MLRIKFQATLDYRAKPHFKTTNQLVKVAMPLIILATWRQRWGGWCFEASQARSSQVLSQPIKSWVWWQTPVPQLGREV
jgi:hypothetical protein